MRAVKLKEHGGAENLYLDDNVPMPELSSPDHILLRIVATAVNRADILQREGKYAPPEGESDILGLEASGVVDEIGANVKKLKIGDHVMALLGGGGYGEFVAVHQLHVMKIPKHVDIVSAAAIPETWLTAYQLVHSVGKVVSGDVVVVHAAGSSVGTAAIQLLKAIPFTYIIAIAGTAEKLAIAQERGAEVIINYKERDFKEAVQEAVKEHGVDVILDPIGASNWQKNIDLFTFDGRWIVYGLMGGSHIDGNLLGQMLKKRIRLLTTTLRTRTSYYKQELVSEFSRYALEKFQYKRFRPIIDSITTLDQVEEAHKRMEANLNVGKIIMKFNDKDPISITGLHKYYDSW